MSWAVSAVGLFVLIIAVVGFGATAFLGRAAVAAADPQGNTAYLLGARAAFGADASTAETLVFTTVTTALFLTLLASVAGMILACANSLAHDVFAHRRTPLTARKEMTLARVSALSVGVPAILLATFVQHYNLQPLVTLSFCLGASALAPALVYSLFWRRYTSTGLVWTLLGGTASCLVLMTGTNLVSGSPTSAFPGQDFNWFPFTTTGIVSIPLGFLFGWLGTLASSRRTADGQRRQYEAVEAWILAGATRQTPRGRTGRPTTIHPPGPRHPTGGMWRVHDVPPTRGAFTSFRRRGRAAPSRRPVSVAGAPSRRPVGEAAAFARPPVGEGAAPSRPSCGEGAARPRGWRLSRRPMRRGCGPITARRLRGQAPSRPPRR